MCVLDNTAQGLGQGKKQATLKMAGMGHGEIQQAADSRQRAGI
jgi:hypothetical protein